MNALYAITILLVFAACSSTRTTNLTNTSAHQARSISADSVVYAKLTFEADQKDFLPQMLGQWVMHTMQRQVMLPEETLNISLQLKDDKSYVVTTDCGDIKGRYSIKGVSIRFTDAAYHLGQCNNPAKLDEMVRLLTSRVSLYTVNGNMLFLKDNSGNNVFRITR